MLKTLKMTPRAAVRVALGLSALGLATGSAYAEEQMSGGLEEVVVTAQFRAERLQETPIAITAITGDALAARGLTNIAEVGSTAPNVTLRVANAAFGKSTQAYIRGVGQGDFNFAYEPGVGMYIDDVYHSTVFGSVFDLLDLERVEVLRGPQGTLFGKNSIGGAVRMIAKKPEGDGSGYVDLTYGSFNRIDLRAGIDVALSDDLFMRVSGVSKSREGYMDQLDFVCANPTQAGNLISQMRTLDAGCKIGTFGGESVQGARVALRYIGIDRLEVNFATDYLNDDSEVQANKLIYVDPTAPNVARWNNNVNVPNFGIPYDQRFITDSLYSTYATLSDPVRRTSIPNESGVESWGSSLKLDYELTDSLSLKSVTAYRSYEGQFGYDQDGSPFSMQNTISDLRHRQFSQELQATGVVGDVLDYTVGAFYFEGNSHYGGLVQQNLANLAFNQNDRYQTKNKSVFAHAVYHITDRLNAVVGARYTDESKEMRFDHPPFLTVPDPSKVSYSRTDWRGGLDFKITDDVMVYGQVATGFRSGGFNPRPFTAAQLVGFGPEELTSYELGAKTELFDRMLRLNVALFYSDYQDRIRNEQSVDGDGLPFSRPMNVGEATVEGIEIEFEAQPIDGLLLTGTYGYAEVDYDELAGRQNPGLPEHQASASAQYSIPLPSGATLVPRLDWTYQSEVFYDDANTWIGREGATSLLNSRVTWDSADGDWSVALAVTNLTDKEYFVNRFPKLALGQGTVEGQPGRPREWSVQIKRRF